MLYDVRTYTCRPGTIKKQLAIYAEYGYPVQTKHLGKPLLYAATETGDVNSYMHIWKYENAADREQRRANMLADPRWIAPAAPQSWKPTSFPKQSWRKRKLLLYNPLQKIGKVASIFVTFPCSRSMVQTLETSMMPLESSSSTTVCGASS